MQAEQQEIACIYQLPGVFCASAVATNRMCERDFNDG